MSVQELSSQLGISLPKAYDLVKKEKRHSRITRLCRYFRDYEIPKLHRAFLHGLFLRIFRFYPSKPSFFAYAMTALRKHSSGG